MSILHAKSNDVIDLAPFGRWRLQNEQSKAIFKSSDLEVIRLVLLKGQLMPVHQVSGDITIYCIEGFVEVLVKRKSKKLKQNQFMYLEGGIPHSVKAIDDCSVLVTIALK